MPFDLKELAGKSLKEKERLQKRIAELEDQLVVASNIKQLIHGLDVRFDQEPAWLQEAGHKSAIKDTRGIPVLNISDIHFDEIVRPSEIGYMNKFNRTIAVRRIKQVFAMAKDLFLHYLVNPKYPGIVVNFLGDFLAGIIHEEIRENLEGPIFESLLELQELLYWQIKDYADVFGKVFIPCVVGNHGRLDQKPRHKHKAQDNFDWLLYQELAKQFQIKNDKRVTFMIPDGPDARYRIYGTDFLITHGDQFRGGSGISEFFYPLMLGVHRKQKKQASIGSHFRVMICGHFHQYIHTSKFIVNGSIKGYDEFANDHNFEFEEPQQAAFVIHRDHGIVYRMPVLCEHRKYKKASKGLVVFGK